MSLLSDVMVTFLSSVEVLILNGNFSTVPLLHSVRDTTNCGTLSINSNTGSQSSNACQCSTLRWAPNRPSARHARRAGASTWLRGRSATRPRLFTPREEPHTHWLGGWVGPRASHNELETIINPLPLPKIKPRFLGCPSRKLFTILTEGAVLAPNGRKDTLTGSVQ